MLIEGIQLDEPFCSPLIIPKLQQRLLLGVMTVALRPVLGWSRQNDLWISLAAVVSTTSL